MIALCCKSGAITAANGWEHMLKCILEERERHAYQFHEGFGDEQLLLISQEPRFLSKWDEGLSRPTGTILPVFRGKIWLATPL